MKKILLATIGLTILLIALFFAGPYPSKPEYSLIVPYVPDNADSLCNYITKEEAQHKLRIDNEARIVWENDSTKQKTDYSIVYLHGFSSSQGDGIPTHTTIAKDFGCNLFLSRLAECGIDTTEHLINLTADKYWESAKEALAIGNKIGKKVILMGSSTGGTLALKLAATYPDAVAGIVLFSPNIAINDPNAWILNKPWGLQIARLVKKGNYVYTSDSSGLSSRYWNTSFRLEAAVALQELLATSMNKETFAKVHQPTLCLYYYKDEVHQDPVVKVSAMKEMLSEIATPDSLKRGVAIPNAGKHELASGIRSKDVGSTIRETESFLKEVMHLQKKL